jgi:UDP-N-acetylglucosamine 2-epimerase (non-hydrolysing)/GDP/UDP-N,N'-diacetylbacillosamine 2-epimerase (hydrolysing)
LIVTAMHLAPEFGSTVQAIEADGWPILARVPTLDGDDTGLGVARAVGRGVSGIAEVLERERPDLVVIVGDRFEQLAAAEAALFLGLPIAHLFGGDITEGAFDESIRHAITKLANLHFVSTAGAARRVIQLGEDPARVHVVGSPAIDDLIGRPRLSREDLEAQLGVDLHEPVLLVTFHPATRDPQPTGGQVDELLRALERQPSSTTIVMTRANADPAGRAINARLEAWAAGREQVHVFDSLGNDRYHGLLALATAVVGNSSSGLYEAPSFGVPTVNIGDRQLGRERATSVIDVPAEAAAIATGIERALATPHAATVNPYGDGHATERIVKVLRAIRPAELLRKRFHEVPG